NESILYFSIGGFSEKLLKQRQFAQKTRWAANLQGIFGVRLLVYRRLSCLQANELSSKVQTQAGAEGLSIVKRGGGIAGVSLLMAATCVLCPAQQLPSDAGNYAAKVISLQGQVEVLRDGQPWALDVGSMVQVQQVILTGPDGHAAFEVSDGSTFEVFPNSNVVFRKNAPNWRDLLDVFVGRVKIHIQHWGGVPNPNRVLTPTAVISVRGTTFDVSVSDDDETTLVEVEEGEVWVQHALLPRGNPKVLKTGDSIRVYKLQPLDASTIDKNAMVQKGLRSLLDALFMVLTHDPKLDGGHIPAGGSGGPGLPGDTKGTPPPAPGPPPPPAP
ncbi:MAG: FecR family protein, partial [Bryobacteraceae bacterium]